MKYQVVLANDLIKLKERVNGLLEIGWKLQGGIAVDGKWYYQAMVKEE